MTTRNVSYKFDYPVGSPWIGGLIRWSLLEPFATATTVVPAHTWTDTLDASGEGDEDLEVPDSGTAHYQVITPDNKDYQFYLAAGAPTDLQTLITIATTAVDQDAVQTLIDASKVIAITNVTTTYIVLSTDDLVRCDGTFTVTLPTATGSGACYLIKNIGTGLITLDGAGTDTIDTLATYPIYAKDWLSVIDAAAGAWDIG